MIGALLGYIVGVLLALNIIGAYSHLWVNTGEGPKALIDFIILGCGLAFGYWLRDVEEEPR